MHACINRLKNIGMLKDSDAGRDWGKEEKGTTEDEMANISSSVVPFSSCPQSLPASESFPMSQLFPGGGQSTEVSALASFLPKNTQG